MVLAVLVIMNSLASLVRRRGDDNANEGRIGASSLAAHTTTPLPGDFVSGRGGDVPSSRRRSGSAARWQDSSATKGYVPGDAREPLDSMSQYKHVPAGATWRGEVVVDNRVRAASLADDADVEHDINIRANARIANARGAPPARGAMLPGKLSRAMEAHLNQALENEEADAESVISSTTVRQNLKPKTQVVSIAVQTQSGMLAQSGLTRNTDGLYRTPTPLGDQKGVSLGMALDVKPFDPSQYEPRPILWAPKAVNGFSRKLVGRVAEAEREAIIAKYDAEFYKMRGGGGGGIMRSASKVPRVSDTSVGTKDGAKDGSRDAGGGAMDGRMSPGVGAMDGRMSADGVDKRDYELLMMEKNEILGFITRLFTDEQKLHDYEMSLRDKLSEANLVYSDYSAALEACEIALAHLCEHIHVPTCAALLLPSTFPWIEMSESRQSFEHLTCVAAAVHTVQGKGGGKIRSASQAQSGGPALEEGMPLTPRAPKAEEGQALQVLGASSMRTNETRYAPSSAVWTSWDMNVDVPTPCFEMEEAEIATRLMHDRLGRAARPVRMPSMALPVFEVTKPPKDAFRNSRGPKDVQKVCDKHFFDFRARRRRASHVALGEHFPEEQLRKDATFASSDPPQMGVITVHNFEDHNALNCGYVEELGAMTGRVVGEVLSIHMASSRKLVDTFEHTEKDFVSENAEVAHLIEAEALIQADLAKLVAMLESSGFKRNLNELLRYTKPSAAVVEVVLAMLTLGDISLIVPDASAHFKRQQSVRPKQKKKSSTEEGVYTTPRGKHVSYGVSGYRGFLLDALFMASHVDKNLGNSEIVGSAWEILRKQPTMQVVELVHILKHANHTRDDDDGKYIDRLHRCCGRILASIGMEKVKRSSSALVLIYEWCRGVMLLRKVFKERIHAEAKEREDFQEKQRKEAHAAATGVPLDEEKGAGRMDPTEEAKLLVAEMLGKPPPPPSSKARGGTLQAEQVPPIDTTTSKKKLKRRPSSREKAKDVEQLKSASREPHTPRVSNYGGASSRSQYSDA